MICPLPPVREVPESSPVNPCVEIQESFLFCSDVYSLCGLQASDSTFCAKLRESLSKNRRFSWNTRTPKDEFVVEHYAGRVAYNCLKFLDKNRDSISPGDSEPVVAAVCL